MKVRYLIISIAVISLVALSAFVAPAGGEGTSPRPQQQLGGTVHLHLAPIEQAEATSCGEAALTMAYNYAHPHAGIGERAFIDYAESKGLFTPRRAPFTSPANMVTIAQHFAGLVLTGNVASAKEGLGLLWQQLEAGRPVVIDITMRLDDPELGAHFVVITGLSVDPLKGKTTVNYNNPLVGEANSADWDGQ